MKIRISVYYLAGLMAFITFAVYLTSLQNSFVLWDDEYYVLENPHIRSLDLSFFKWAFFDFYASNWHPLTWISHAIDYAIWGLDPMGHHLTNNILHSLNTFLVVLLVARLIEAVYSEQYAVSSRAKGSEKSAVNSKKEGEISDRPGTDGFSPLTTHYSRFTSHDSRFTLIAAGVTGLLFGLHPIHVESVAWVAERKDLLCALFYLLSVLAYVKNATTPFTHGLITPPPPPYLKGGWRSRGRYFLPLLFFTLALLSKPMAVTLPFVLLILDWYPLQKITSFKTFRKSFIEKLPFIVMSIGSSILTVLAQKAGGTLATIEAIPLSTRVLVAANSLSSYLWNIIVPVRLIPYYPYPKDAALFSAEYIFASALAVAITAACIVIAKKQKLLPAAWTYYVVTLVPVLGIVQVGGQAMADRYTYLPSLGPFFLAGIWVAYVLGKMKPFRRWVLNIRLIAIMPAILGMLALTVLTYRQIEIWKNSLTLWTSVIEEEPTGVSVAYNNRGLAFLNIGEIDRAIADLRQAIVQQPQYTEAHSNLGVALSKKGLVDDAIIEFQIAVRLDPGFANAHRNLAPALYMSGRIAEALEEYIIVTKLLPNSGQAHAELASVYGAIGSYDKAIEHFQIALQLSPDLPDVHYNLGIAFQRKGLMKQAAEHLEAAARLDPADSSIRDALAEIYNRKNSAAKH